MSGTRESARRIKRTRHAAVGSGARDKQEPRLGFAKPVSEHRLMPDTLRQINDRLERLRREIRRVAGIATPLPEPQTIASGVVTLNFAPGSTVRVVTVDTEGAAATDDLDTIDGASDNDIVIVKSADSTHDVRLTNAGNLRLGPFGAFTLLTTDDRAIFHSDGTNLYALSVHNN